jgi:hypothetical protein
VNTNTFTIKILRTKKVERVGRVAVLQKQWMMIEKSPIDRHSTCTSLVRRRVIKHVYKKNKKELDGASGHGICKINPFLFQSLSPTHTSHSKRTLNASHLESRQH